MTTEKIIASLKPADIILAAQTGEKFQNLFRRLMSWRWKNPVRFTHVLAVGSVNPATTIEAQERVVRRDEFHLRKLLERSDRRYKIVRKDNLPGITACEIVVNLEAQLGTPYGVSTILLHGVSWIFHSRWIVSRLSRTAHVVCSSAVAKAYQDVIGLRFNGIDWWAVTPDDIDDETSQAGWMIVAQNVEGL